MQCITTEKESQFKLTYYIYYETKGRMTHIQSELKNPPPPPKLSHGGPS